MAEASPTRARLVSEAMRLFGEHGYAATSVAMIEQAAGLSPGSGSLYKHFASKQELLTEGLELLLRGTSQLTSMMTRSPSRPLPRGRAAARAELTEIVGDVARGGLARMEQDRDLNRLLFRGLEAFPSLKRRFRDEELHRVQQATSELLAQLRRAFHGNAVHGNGSAKERGRHQQDHDEDWDAVAVVLVGAVAHYWLLRDVFGEHPSGVDESRFVAAAARAAASVLTT